MDYPYYFNLNPNWSAYAPVPMPVPSAIQQNTPSSNNQMISSQNGTELEEVSSQGKTAKGKSYETWSKDEEKLLVDLWVENHELLESKDSRKTWGKIVEELNRRLRCNKTVEKCIRKMKYIISRYKELQEWNRKQTGGHIRKSVHYDKIDSVLGCRDIVTLKHVVDSSPPSRSQSESSSPVPSTSSASANSNTDGGDSTPSPDDRLAKKKRGKGKKRKVAEIQDSDDEMKTLMQGIQKQSGEVTDVLKTMQQTQMQQLSLMTKFMEKMFEGQGGSKSN